MIIELDMSSSTPIYVQTDGSALLCPNPSQMIQISLKSWNQSLSF